MRRYSEPTFDRGEDWYEPSAPFPLELDDDPDYSSEVRVARRVARSLAPLRHTMRRRAGVRAWSLDSGERALLAACVGCRVYWSIVWGGHQIPIGRETARIVLRDRVSL